MAANGLSFRLLRQAFEDFEADDEMYVAVFYGNGGNFCAGFDLEELSTFEDDLANNIASTMFDSGPMVEITRQTRSARFC